MGAFGSMPLADKFGIVLGGLIIFTFAAGITKILINRRKLKKANKYREIEAARNTTEKVIPRGIREGDLFGVRAIEHGFYGGVAQSKPPTPSPLSNSTTPSQKSSPISPIRSMTPSGGILPAIPRHMQHRPTPLRLRPQEAVYNKARGDLPSPGHELSSIQLSPIQMQSNISVRSMATTDSDGGWVSPLDVHFSRPQTPASLGRERPGSYLPRLQFPEGELKEEIGKNVRLVFVPTHSSQKNSMDLKSEAASSHKYVPTPSSSQKNSMDLKSEATSFHKFVPTPSSSQKNSMDLKSEAVSFHNGPEITIPEQARSKVSPTFSLFPNTPHRAPSQRARCVVSPREETRVHKPSRDNLMLDAIPPPPPVPDTDDYFLEFAYTQGYSDDQGGAVMRDSVVSKHRVSIYQPQRHQSQSPDTMIDSRKRSTSIHSAKSSNSRNRSRSSESRSRTRKHKRSESSHSIARTQDSLRRGLHLRKISQDTENRRSRDRDQLHYDPHNHHRNRSGSVQGRTVNFDSPRVNPFADGNTISSNQPHKSAATTQDIDSVLDNSVSQMNITLEENSRKRSNTNESQGSIGELYESYYSRPDIAQIRKRTNSVSKTANNGFARGQQQIANVEIPSPVRYSRRPSFI